VLELALKASELMLYDWDILPRSRRVERDSLLLEHIGSSKYSPFVVRKYSADNKALSGVRCNLIS